MSQYRSVYLVSNALPPGFGCPTAAPGLRTWGLRQGLVANGVDATIIVPRSLVTRQMERWSHTAGNGAFGSVAVSGVVVLESREIMEFLVSQGPAVVLMTNSGSYSSLERHPLLRIGMDFFSATVLEHRFRGLVAIEKVIAAKREAMALADFYLVNGSRRVAYCHGWLASTGRDLGDLALPVVNMCLPARIRPSTLRSSPPIRLMIAGYDQAWAPLRPVLELLERLTARLPVEVTVISVADYWKADGAGELGALLERLSEHGSFRILKPMDYEAFGTTLHGIDVFVDLFAENVERRYSMSTRAVVALAHGVPVLHPGFTELGEMIRSYDAGWTDVRMGDGLIDGLERVILDLVGKPEILKAKREAAVKLLFDHFNPTRETAGMLPMLRL